MFDRLRRVVLGPPLNPLSKETRSRMTLAAFLAWVGLGADALSSSCYGPAKAYLSLGVYNHLAVFIAIFTMITVFIICLGYNQVIELFPGGGGGYKVATKLLHPYAGVVAGSALIVDYVLTIAISVASGSDAVFSFLPLSVAPYKIYFSAGLIFALMVLNLRGMKEAIIVLLPIVIGFVIVHAGLIAYGVFAHADGLSGIMPEAIRETSVLADSVGWFIVIGVMLQAYSLGAGTYTGIEAVSNNVQNLAEPKAETGKQAMMYLAVSLSLMAGGLILLYLLWNAYPQPGKTLNAVVFANILGDSWSGQSVLVLTLQLEALLLFVAANAGFAAGPSVLANMAADGWLPKRFRYLSNRLVVQNGLLLFGVAALIVLFGTHGSVDLLVVLYSINVFITFSLSFLGVAVYWIKHRQSQRWFWHFAFSVMAFVITAGILLITMFYKFSRGGWVTLLITAMIVVTCLLVRRHYMYVSNKLGEIDALLRQPVSGQGISPMLIDPKKPTAIIFVNNFSVGMHTLLSILRIFPGQFTNFIFLSAGEVDTESFRGEHELKDMQAKVDGMLDYFVRYCQEYQIPAEAYSGYGTDSVYELECLAEKISDKYPQGIFFSSRLVFVDDSPLKWILHNHTPLLLQQYLHLRGKELMILPMKL